MFFNLARNSGSFGKLLFLSSGAVYDRREPLARIPETHFDHRVPTDPYGFSKYICAKHVAQSDNLFELRLFGVFGPYEDWEVRFLSNACCRALWDLPVTLKQNVRFDYLDVADLAKVVRWFIEGQPRHRSYNVCTGRAVDLTASGQKVVRASGKNLEVAVRNPGLGEEYSGDNRRLMEELPDFQFARSTIPSGRSTTGMRRARCSSIPRDCISTRLPAAWHSCSTRHNMTITESTIQQQIGELLREGREGAIRREQTAFDEAVGSRGASLVLFGAGGIGRKTLAGLRQVGIEPLAFADNNKALWGTRIDVFR